jgi:hypothetical protein
LLNTDIVDLNEHIGADLLVQGPIVDVLARVA